MHDDDLLARAFDRQRSRLHALAYRMLGSSTEADDAVQEVWLRLSRSDADAIDNLGAWLTTVTARVCLNGLRSRTHKREEPFDRYVPDPVVQPWSPSDPADDAVLADSVGLALLVVLDTLAPPERLAFVLHDMFGVPFEEIAPMVERTPEATRQLASRARRRVHGAAVPDRDRNRQREVVEAFFAAARSGDFDTLVSVLDPEVVLRSDGGTKLPRASALVRGAAEVAGRAIMFRQPTATIEPMMVNGGAGVVIRRRGRVFAVMAFTVTNDKVVSIDVLADPERLAALDIPA